MRLISYVRAILESLTQSLRLVIDVLLFLGFFIVFFGVMGVERKAARVSIMPLKVEYPLSFW